MRYSPSFAELSDRDLIAEVRAARAVRRFPVILERLSSGEITLTSIGLLRPHLTEANHLEILDRARFKLKRDVEELTEHPAALPGA